jgi:hypothetical protein
MRKLNLEVECVEAGIVFTKDRPIDHDMCSKCLVLKGLPVPKKINFMFNFNAPDVAKSNAPPRFPLFRTTSSPAESPGGGATQSTSPLENNKPTKHNIQHCLLCGSPTCSDHSSAAFRKQGITLCMACIETLEFDFENESQDVNILSTRVNQLVDLYDRAILLLKYSSPFMLKVADSLDKSMMHRNKVGVGASSAGLVSGALGVAAACSILTPVGPPLLVASLLFGGSATVVQTGSEAMRYFSEPHKLANRILVLQGVVQSILHTTARMRDTTLVPYLDKAIVILSNKLQKEAMLYPSSSVPGDRDGPVEKVLTTSVRIGSKAALVQMGTTCLMVQEGAAAGRFVTRAGTNLALTARVAQFAGGALSAVTLLMEARQLTKIAKHIRQGSPCDKAAALRTLQSQLEQQQQQQQQHVPSTLTVDSICQSFAKVRRKQVAAEKLLQGQHKLEASYHDDVDEELLLVDEVVSSLEAEKHPRIDKPEPYAPTTTRNLIKLSTSSLLERVQRYKKQDAIDKAEIYLVV